MYMLVNCLISKIKHQQLSQTSQVFTVKQSNEYNLLQLLNHRTYVGLYSKIKCEKREDCQEKLVLVAF